MVRRNRIPQGCRKRCGGTGYRRAAGRGAAEPDTAGLPEEVRRNRIPQGCRKGCGEIGNRIITIIILSLAAAGDLRRGKVDNRLILAGLGTGLFMQILTGIPNGLGDLIVSGILPLLCGWLLFRIHAFGACDIKLFCIIGILNGCHILAITTLCSLGIAAGYGLFRLIRSRQLIAALTDLVQYGTGLLTTGQIGRIRRQRSRDVRSILCGSSGGICSDPGSGCRVGNGCESELRQAMNSNTSFFCS